MHSKNLFPKKRGFKKALAKKFAESAGIFFTMLLVFSAIVYAYTTWAPGGPPQVAPGAGNVVLPVVSSVWGTDGTNVYRTSGSVGIGDATPDAALKLDIEGKIGATEYCDEDGNNCTAAIDLGGGGGGGGGTDTVLGNWENRALNTVYQASTDGFVVARMGSICHGCGWIRGYTDSTNPPSTLRTTNGSGYVDVGGGGTITMPVRKNDYWKVTRGCVCAGAVKVYWIPLSGGGGGVIDYGDCEIIRDVDTWTYCSANYVVVGANFWSNGAAGSESIKCCRLK